MSLKTNAWLRIYSEADLPFITYDHMIVIYDSRIRNTHILDYLPREKPITKLFITTQPPVYSSSGIGWVEWTRRTIVTSTFG